MTRRNGGRGGGRRGAGGGPPAPFVPSLYGTVGMWLRGDDVTLNASDIASWNDKSGNARHWTQGTAANQPGQSVASLGGRNGIAFTAANSDRLLGPAAGLPFTAAESFLVLRVNADPPATGAASGLWAVGSVGTSQHYPFTDSNIYDGFGSTTRQAVGNPTPSLATARVYGVATASGNWSAYLDGALIFGPVANTVGWTINPTLGDGGAVFFDGIMWEWLIYTSVLSAGNRAAVVAGLKTYYAMP